MVVYQMILSRGANYRDDSLLICSRLGYYIDGHMAMNYLSAACLEVRLIKP